MSQLTNLVDERESERGDSERSARGRGRVRDPIRERWRVIERMN